MEVAKALGGSFKFVTLAPKTVREMTQLPKEIKEWGHTNKSKRRNKHAKHKNVLNNVFILRNNVHNAKITKSQKHFVYDVY